MLQKKWLCGGHRSAQDENIYIEEDTVLKFSKEFIEKHLADSPSRLS
jgi:hypothetical protein